MSRPPFINIILRNSFHLYVYQASLYLFPLIIFPYLFRALGAANFGYISFVIAYFAYFNKIIEFSFNIYSVRDVSVSNDKQSSVIFSRVLFLKVLLFMISLPVLLLFYSLFLHTKIDIESFWFSIGSLFALVLTPYWFFKGKQEMKFISIFNIINKSLTLVLILVYVDKPEDYIYYFAIDFITNILIAIIVLYFVFIKYKIKLIIEPYKVLFNYFKEGFMIFITEMCAFIYSSSNVLILGVFLDSSIVGYYSLSEKIINLTNGIFSPFVQAAFPTLSILTKQSKNLSMNFIIKISRIMGVVGLILSLLIFIFSNIIINILIGYDDETAIFILKVLSPIIFSYSLATIFSNLYLHSFGLFKVWNKLVIFTFLVSVFFLVFLIIMTHNYLNSVMFTSLFSEIGLTIVSIIIFFRNKSTNTYNDKC